MNFETVIGLEVHVELNTNSKIFSPTSTHFGNDQNTNTNVIDWSFPGVLPSICRHRLPFRRPLLQLRPHPHNLSRHFPAWQLQHFFTIYTLCSFFN